MGLQGVGKTIVSAGLAVAAGLTAGCGYTQTADVFMKPYEAGQFAQAAQAADQVVGPVKDAQGTDPNKLLKVDPSDAVVFRLEQGSIDRAVGRLEESTLAFNHADDLMRQADEKADVRISTEVGAAVTNQTFRDYEGYSYDRLALELYQALNYLQLGRFDDARTALRAMQQRQEEAEEHFRKKIDALEEKKDKNKAGNGEQAQQSVDVAKTEQDPQLTRKLKSVYGKDAPIVPDRTAYQPYSNPFGEYLQGVYFMAAGLNSSDAETAAVAFKRVRGMLPDNVYVAQDLALAEKVASGASVPPTTYVFFETGLAPIREEIRIDIPVFVVNLAWKDTGVDYVGAAFPKLKFREGYTPYLTVNAGGHTYQTTVLTDMDTVIQKDFNNELPLVITRTIIATVTKAAAAYALNRASEGNTYANILTRVGTTVYQVGMNQADLRTWETLPKQFQIARFPTPENRQLTLALPNGAVFPPLTLEPGVVNIVYVKSVQANQTPAIQQFKLK